MAQDATRDRLIEATMRLVSEQGPTGTGTARILREAGAQRGSLYFHFPAGKDELVRIAVQGSGARTAARIEAVLAEPVELPERLARYFEVVAQELLDEDYAYGCPVGATALDLAAGSADARGLTGDIFASWAEAVAAHLRAEGVPAADAAELGTAFVAGIEGATMLARALRDPGPLRATGRTLAAAVRAALP